MDWNYVLSFVKDYLPLIISCVGVVTHFLVFHRLKCTKDLSTCLKEDFLEKFKGGEQTITALYRRQLQLDSRLDEYAEVISRLNQILDEVKKDGRND